MIIRRFAPAAVFAVLVSVGATDLTAQGSPQRPVKSTAESVRTAARRDTARARLRTSIDSIVSQPQYRNAQWGVLVVDPESGDTLYSRNAEKLFVPASNEKLVTAAVALSSLGPDFRFTTRVAYSGTIRDSILDGDLVVFGSGDPSFSDNVRGKAMIPMYELADSIHLRGIRRIHGQIRRGTPVFTDSPIGYGWAWTDLAATYGATVGDLMYNDAFARVRINVDGVPDTMPLRPPQYRNFLEAFDAALRDRGVYPFLSWDWERTARDTGLTTLFEFRSPPLRDLLAHFTKPSQNQIGEVLLKTLGLTRAGVGTADSGAKVVGRQLILWGADSTGFVVRDGSGLSRQNYLSPETLIRVLDAARRDTTFYVFYDALPVAGVDGTLETRLRGTAAQGNAHAKTGSMDRVRSLTGYVTTADGRLLIFSIMANGWTVPGLEVEAALDSIVVRLAKSRIGP